MNGSMTNAKKFLSSRTAEDKSIDMVRLGYTVYELVVGQTPFSPFDDIYDLRGLSDLCNTSKQASTDLVDFILSLMLVKPCFPLDDVVKCREHRWIKCTGSSLSSSLIGQNPMSSTMDNRPTSVRNEVYPLQQPFLESCTYPTGSEHQLEDYSRWTSNRPPQMGLGSRYQLHPYPPEGLTYPNPYAYNVGYYPWDLFTNTIPTRTPGGQALVSALTRVSPEEERTPNPQSGGFTGTPSTGVGSWVKVEEVKMSADLEGISQILQAAKLASNTDSRGSTRAPNTRARDLAGVEEAKTPSQTPQERQVTEHFPGGKSFRWQAKRDKVKSNPACLIKFCNKFELPRHIPPDLAEIITKDTEKYKALAAAAELKVIRDVIKRMQEEERREWISRWIEVTPPGMKEALVSATSSSSTTMEQSELTENGEAKLVDVYSNAVDDGTKDAIGSGPTAVEQRGSTEEGEAEQISDADSDANNNNTKIATCSASTAVEQSGLTEDEEAEQLLDVHSDAFVDEENVFTEHLERLISDSCSVISACRSVISFTCSSSPSLEEN
jgi:hypothetical protein